MLNLWCNRRGVYRLRRSLTGKDIHQIYPSLYNSPEIKDFRTQAKQ